MPQVNSYLRELRCPLLLLWGERDPWIVSAAGDRLQRIAESEGKDVLRVSVDAGHCPMDEAPDEVNSALLQFLERAQGLAQGQVQEGQSLRSIS